MQLGSGIAWWWCRLAVVVWIQPLAWELPYAVGVALKRPPPQKKERERERKTYRLGITGCLSLEISALLFSIPLG